LAEAFTRKSSVVFGAGAVQVSAAERKIEVVEAEWFGSDDNGSRGLQVMG